MTAGRVGKPHGHDGSFYVDRPMHPLPEGATLLVRERPHKVERRAGTDERPLIRLSGIDDPSAIRSELMLVDEELGDDEWLASDLVGSNVPGHGRVVQIIDGPSCSVLELEDGALVPFVSDAIRSVGEGEIEIDEGFVG